MLSLANANVPAASDSRSSSTASTARHGLHHGAQKSTTIGVPAMAASNVSASSSRMSELSAQRSEPELRHARDRFEEDRAAHLRLAGRPVGEADRHLHHLEPCSYRAVRPFDLEGIALGVDRLEIDAFEHLAPVALEA